MERGSRSERAEVLPVCRLRRKRDVPAGAVSYMRPVRGQRQGSVRAALNGACCEASGPAPPSLRGAQRGQSARARARGGLR